jgi:nicotinamide mononucleotide adenylyltransferase
LIVTQASLTSSIGLWAEEDLRRILGHYGAFILERSGTDIGTVLY